MRAHPEHRGRRRKRPDDDPLERRQRARCSTSAAGEAALKVTGGLSLTRPVGTATIAAGMASTVVSNVYAKSGSIILLTVNNAVDAVPLRIVSQGDGTFTVGLASALVGTLTGGVSFNYLIVNQ